jgi:hypothetical protein
MNVDPFPSHCGSKIFHQLYNPWPPAPWPNKDFTRTIFGIFIDHPNQKRTYTTLAKKFKILYQSPVLKNPSTNRQYFIVIWLNEKP